MKSTLMKSFRRQSKRSTYAETFNQKPKMPPETETATSPRPWFRKLQAPGPDVRGNSRGGARTGAEDCRRPPQARRVSLPEGQHFDVGHLPEQRHVAQVGAPAVELLDRRQVADARPRHHHLLGQLHHVALGTMASRPSRFFSVPLLGVLVTFVCFFVVLHARDGTVMSTSLPFASLWPRGDCARPPGGPLFT